MRHSDIIAVGQKRRGIRQLFEWGLRTLLSTYGGIWLDYVHNDLGLATLFASQNILHRLNTILQFAILSMFILNSSLEGR